MLDRARGLVHILEPMSNSDDIYEKKAGPSPWRSRRAPRDPSASREKTSKDDATEQLNGARRTYSKVDREKKRTLRRDDRRKTLQDWKRRRRAITLWSILGGALLAYVAGLSVMLFEGSIQRFFVAPPPSPARPATSLQAHRRLVKFDPSRHTDIGQMMEKLRFSETILGDIRPLIERGLYDQARQRLDQYSDRLVPTLDLKQAVIDIHVAKEEYDLAVDALTDILSIDPANTDARLQLAVVLANMQEYSKAASVARWAAAARPNDLKAHEIAAEAFMSLGQPEEAIMHYRSILQNDPDDDRIASKMAYAYYLFGEYGKAVLQLKQLIDDGTQDSIVYYHLALCYAKQMLTNHLVLTLQSSFKRFGHEIVRAWIQGPEFDVFRDEPQFQMFVRQMARGPDAGRVTLEQQQARREAEMALEPLLMGPQRDFRDLIDSPND
jgi:tetratricopeptide (TPR) repeat protein